MSHILSIMEGLFDSRLIMIKGVIDTDMSAEIISQILYLNSMNNKEIGLWINSQGGNVTDALAIHDVMKYVKSDISTICFGEALSMAVLLLSSGTKGKRLAFQNSRFLLHSIRGGVDGTAKASQILAETMEVERLKGVVVDILSENTGHKKSKILKDIEHEWYLNVDQAIKYGLIDSFI